jgi:hypothetical protein
MVLRGLLQGYLYFYLCLTNSALRHKGVWGSGCIDPRILDLGTSWKLMLNSRSSGQKISRHLCDGLITVFTRTACPNLNRMNPVLTL